MYFYYAWVRPMKIYSKVTVRGKSTLSARYAKVGFPLDCLILYFSF